jgi:hypothetical protein
VCIEIIANRGMLVNLHNWRVEFIRHKIKP